jgi:hypothetical protein
LAKAEEIGNMGSWEWIPGEERMAWSRNLYRLYGFDPDEVTPSTELLLEHVHPADRELFVDSVARSRRRKGELMTIDYRFIRPDGIVRDLRATIAEIDREQDRLIGLVVDRTDQRRAEREIAVHVAVAEALRAWRSVEESAPELLRDVARALDLERGALWVPRDDALRLRALWQAAESERPELGAEMRATAIPRGVALSDAPGSRASPSSSPT